MMPAKIWSIRKCLFILLSLTFAGPGHAQPDQYQGQFIHIETRFNSFVGKPIWTLIVRDVDHNQNMPYIFDIRKGWNHWIIFTYSRNYTIQASSMQIETYMARYNKFRNYRLRNFCQLESEGRILRGESLHITIEGVLSPYDCSYSCNVMSFPEAGIFNTVPRPSCSGQI